jgi:hypothetical protein
LKLLTACEKLSEVFRGFVKTFHAALGQSALVSAHAFAKQGSMVKQTKITIETDSLLILQGGNSRRAWCPLCGAESEMLALENAGVISNLEKPALEEWLNSGELHRSATADGSALICLNSLLARVQNTKTS